MAAEGRPISYQVFLDSFGQKNDRILALWLGADVSGDRVRRIGDAKEAEYRRLAETHGLTALPGAVDWIHRLHRDGWKQAIASSAPRENVAVMLRALRVDHDFDAIVSAEDVTAGKPDPQVFLKAAAKLQLDPDHCIVVEDAAVGVEAARRAGMKSIGVSRTEPLDATIAVRSLADLPDDAFAKLLNQG